MFIYTRKDESLILYMQTEKKGNIKNRTDTCGLVEHTGFEPVTSTMRM